MAADLILCFDIGTTSVKAGVIGLDGQALSLFAETYPTRRPALGVVEQDPADWTLRIERAVAGIVAAGLAPRIAAIGLTSRQVGPSARCRGRARRSGAACPTETLASVWT